MNQSFEPAPPPAATGAGRALAVACLLGSLVALCAGTSWAKGLFPLVGAAATVALRTGFSALVLVALWRPWRWPLAGRDALWVVLYGAALGFTNLCFYLSLRTVPLGIALAIEFTGPLALAVWSSRRAVDFAWVALAAGGLGLLLLTGGAAARPDLGGAAWALAAGVAWALYIVFGQRAGQGGHGGQVTALGMACAFAVVLPFALADVAARPGGMALLVAPGVLALGVGVGVVSSALPYSLEMVALKRLPRRTFGILLSLEPAIGALAGAAFLAERLTPLQWCGIACVVAAAAGATVTAGAPRSAVADVPPAA